MSLGSKTEMSKAMRIKEMVFILLSWHPVARLCEDSLGFWLGELECNLIFRLRTDQKFYDECSDCVDSLNVIPISRGQTER